MKKICEISLELRQPPHSGYPRLAQTALFRIRAIFESCELQACESVESLTPQAQAVAQVS